jgi:carboxymethylenebutenolidase
MPIGVLDLVSEYGTAVTYRSEGRDLFGFFLTPEGIGPFPGIAFNHGSGGLQPGSRAGADALVRMGYAVFLAVRRGYNGNPGPYWLDRVMAAIDPAGLLFATMGQELVTALSDECADTLAALDWLKAQPQVDAARTAIVGQSFGGIMTVFAAGRTDGFRAGISFAGPSITWPDVPRLQAAMREAVRRATVPLMFIQAINDHSLDPTYTLAAELARLDKPHEVHIFPAHGVTAMDGHGLFRTGSEIWYPDVARFLAHWLA